MRTAVTAERPLLVPGKPGIGKQKAALEDLREFVFRKDSEFVFRKDSMDREL